MKSYPTKSLCGTAKTNRNHSEGNGTIRLEGSSVASSSSLGHVCVLVDAAQWATREGARGLLSERRREAWERSRGGNQRKDGPCHGHDRAQRRHGHHGLSVSEFRAFSIDESSCY